MKRNLMKILGTMALLVGVVVPSFASRELPDTLRARDVFANLPVKTLDILSHNTRLDMLDYYDLDSIYQARNGMEGVSELVKVSPDYLKVSLTPVSTMEIGMLKPKKGNEPAAVVLYTVGADSQAEDTEVSFFDSDLKELPREKYLEYPDVLDFFNTNDKNIKELIEDLVPFPTMRLTFLNGAEKLQGVLTVGEFMGEENFDKIKSYLKPDLTFVWDGKKYKLRQEKDH
ncbi:MAG: DUF3256 family protein [Muribaculaceae bacterium]|nr:DUF3256 family protein [Muribaculaceae bacterium]